METEQINSGVEEVSLSIEETNKLRLSLGLKPLDESKGSSSDQKANSNFAAEKRRLQRRQERKELIERLAREQNKERMFAKLDGKTLGEAEDDTDDPLEWARRHKQKAAENTRKLVERKMKELEELDAEYTEKDLAGLRVGHSLADIKDEILVLADKQIIGKKGADGGDEDDEDELVSSALTAKERLERNLKNKTKKTGYNAYDDDEFGPGQKRSLLSQYDDEPEKEGFVIGKNGRVAAASQEDDTQFGGGKTVTLQYEKMQEIKDYYTSEEAVAFMKPKKKKKKAKGRSKDEEGIWPTADDKDNMDVDEPSYTSFSRSNATSNVQDMNFVDDDDLQIALSRARMLANKKVKVPTTEEMLEAVESIHPNDPLSNTEKKEIDDDDDGLLVLTATSEFVNSITTAAPAQLTAAERAAEKFRARKFYEDSDDDEDDDRDGDKETEGKNNNAMEIADSGEEHVGWKEVSEQQSVAVDEEEDELVGGGIEEEPLVSNGLAATLALLGKQGFIEKIDDERLESERRQRERAKWLAEQRIQDRKAEILKEREKARQREINKAKGPAKRGSGNNQNSGEREDDWKLEEDQRAAERQRARELEEKFKNYAPDVNIKYNDEYGRELTPKEAFRFLSHKFHGKGSGKMKTEKRLLKMDEEANLQKMKSSDTPLGTASALLEKTKANKAAHLVLSVGNRGSLPSEVIAKEEKALMEKMQKKAAAAALAKSVSKKSSGSGSTSGTGPKANVSSGSGGTASSVPGGERNKVAFGLGSVKRKAEAATPFEDIAPKRTK